MTFFSFESEPVPGPDGVKTTEQRLFPVRGRATAQFSNQCLRTGGFYSEFLYISEQYQEVSCWPVRRTRDLSVPINQGHRPSAKEGSDVTGLLEYSQHFAVVREILVIGTASREATFSAAVRLMLVDATQNPRARRDLSLPVHAI